jgi:hypothetical protein
LPKQRQRRHAGRGGDGDEHGGALLVEARCGPAAVECGEDSQGAAGRACEQRAPTVGVDEARISETLLPKRIALPAFAGAALSSGAYVPDEIS